jgi:hypothetical protein
MVREIDGTYSHYTPMNANPAMDPSLNLYQIHAVLHPFPADRIRTPEQFSGTGCDELNPIARARGRENLGSCGLCTVFAPHRLLTVS